MQIHYQELQPTGLRVSYVSRPQGDIDQIVRDALNLGDLKPGATHFPENQPCIVLGEGDADDLYYTPDVGYLRNTRCHVIVPKDDSPVFVGIQSDIPLPGNALESMVTGVVINKKLIPAGLVPMDSEREIVAQYLKDGHF